MVMTEPKAPTQPLPDGWSLWVRRGRWRMGWIVSGLFELEKAPHYVQAEAKTFSTGVEYDPEIVRRWSLLRARTIRWVEQAVRDLEDCPRSEWLDARFASGKPDAVLARFANGDPIVVRYYSGRAGDEVTELAGYLRVESWTSIGAGYRDYSIDHDLPTQDGSNTHLSEFGLVWDARPLS